MDIPKKILLEKIINIINYNGINGLIRYIRDNDIKIENLKSTHDDDDILIKSIINNFSLEVVKYIIINAKYKTLNYLINSIVSGPKTPLTLAIELGNIELAEILITYGAEINESIKLLSSTGAIDKLFKCSHSYYMLKKGILITNNFIIELIERHRNNFLKILFNDYIFDNTFILKLLTISNEKKKLSKNNLYDILNKEREKIVINKEMYDSAICNSNYVALNILYNNDIRSKDIRLNEIFNRVNICNSDIKKEFIKNIKSKQLKFINEEEDFVKKLENYIINMNENEISNTIEETKQLMQNLIKSNNNIKLEKIVQKVKNRIEFNKYMYELAFNNGNDSIINILFTHDKRNRDTLLKEVFQIIEKLESNEKKISYVNKIENGEIMIQADGFYLNNLLHSEEIRKVIKENIRTNKILELKSYLEKNKILLNYFNSSHFDLLIFAIENDASIRMIKFLVNYYSLLDYYIYDEINEKYKSPLSCAISNSKFFIFKLLLKFGANIEYNIHDLDLLSKLDQENILSSRNLNFILSNNFLAIKNIISKLIKDNKYLMMKQIFEYFIFDPIFISSLLSIYKNQRPLSNSQLNSMILKEKRKINMEYDWFYNAICFDNEEALKLLHYYGDYDSISKFTDYEKCNLLDEAMDHDNFKFILELIGNENFNFNYGLELFLSNKYLSKKKLKYKLKNIKFIINKLFLTNKLLNFKIVNFEKILINLSKVINSLNEKEVEYLSVIDLFIKSSFSHKTFNFNKINIERITFLLCDYKYQNVPVLNCFLMNLFDNENFDIKCIQLDKILTFLKNLEPQDNKILSNLMLEKIMNHPTYDYKLINFDYVLSFINQCNNYKLIGKWIDKSFDHESFTIENCNIKKILQILSQLDNSISVINSFIMKLMNSSQFNLVFISLEDLVLPIIKINNIDLFKLVIETIFNHKTFEFEQKIKELMIVAYKIKEETTYFNIFIQNIFNNEKLIISSQFVETILLIVCKMNDEAFVKLIIEDIFSSRRSLNLKTLNFEKILLFANRCNNAYIIQWVVEKLKENDDLMNVIDIEKVLLSASKVDNKYMMQIFIKNLFNISPLNRKELSTIDLSWIKKKENSFLSLIINVLIKLHYISLIKYLIENNKLNLNINLNMKDKNGEFPLITAASTKNLKIFEYLLNRGVNTNVKDINGKSLFELCLKNENFIIIQKLLKENMINEWINSDKENLLPIIRAIYLNNIDEIYALIKDKDEHNKDKNNTYNCFYNSFTPLTLSYLLNHQDIFKVLINFVDINEIDGYGYNILHYSILKDDIQMVKYLINKGANVNFNKGPGMHGHSAINISIIIKNDKILSFLFQNQFIPINKLDMNMESPLMVLIKTKNYSIEEKLNLIEMLLNSGQIMNLVNDSEDVNKSAKNLLIKCLIDYGELEVIQYFIKYSNNNNNNIFIDEIVKIIISENKLELLKGLILNNYLDIHWKNENGDCFLNYAIDTQNIEIAQYLLEKGCRMDNSNYKILKKVYNSSENTNFIRLLIPKYIDIQNENKENKKMILKDALEYGNEAVLEYLINCGLEVQNIDEKSIENIIYRYEFEKFKLLVPKYFDREDDNLLIKVIESKNRKIFKYLMDIKPISQDIGSQLLRKIICTNSFDLLKILINSENGDIKCNVNMIDKYGDIPLNLAIKNENKKIIEHLIDNGADLNGKDSRNFSPLVYALQELKDNEENDDIIKYLIDYGANINEINKEGSTPLIYAIRKGKINIVHYLVEHGADINTKTSYGISPLVTAIYENNDILVEYLLNHGANVNEKSEDDGTPLHYAIAILTLNKYKSVNIVNNIIESGANLNIKNISGNTPLLLAIKVGDMELIEKLKKRGAQLEPNCPPNKNFVKIIDDGAMDLVKKFNLYGIDINLAFMYAIEKDNVEVMNYLIEHFGAKINEQVRWDHLPPLQIAIKNNNINAIKCLMEHHAVVRWNLHYAIKLGNKEIIKYLIEHGANVNYQQNRCSSNPLVKVGEHGNVNILRYLLDHGADLNQFYFHLSKIDGERKEMKVLLIALMNRKIGVAKYMIDSGADVTRVRGFFDNEPLKYAIQSTNYELVKYLVDHGAEVDDSWVESAIMTGEIDIVKYLIDHVKGCGKSFYRTNKFFNYHNEYYDLNVYYQIKEILDNKREEINSIKK